MSPNLDQLLQQALNKPTAKFHKGQKEAIEAVINPPHRALVIQATGWGKSMVYFIATKVFRDQGRGPTLVISPLLSLMRNQLAATQHLGLKAAMLTSANPDEWGEVIQQIQDDKVDLLLVSPERLANERFRALMANTKLATAGMIVIDEAHCISDWGHDFRPDYQRLGEMVKAMPPTTAVLATTATANKRVEKDVFQQLGSTLKVHRGSLARKTLALQTIYGMSQVERLAWLSDHLPDLPNTGIIYTLTVRDTERVAEWLVGQGHNVQSYFGSLPEETRIEREEALLQNKVKALVATTALGMGFDKPDVGFVVHFQSPGNLVAYYQQVGRAGRAIQEAKAILFLGEEDQDIHSHFIENALPKVEDIDQVIDFLDQVDSASLNDIKNALNLRHSVIEDVLKHLTILSPAPVVKDGGAYQRTPVEFRHDTAHRKALADSKRGERQRFVDFIKTDKCLMQEVREELDDPDAKPCQKCSNCAGDIVSREIHAQTLHQATVFVGKAEFPIKPRKQWPKGCLAEYGFNGNIKDLMLEPGLCLSHWGDAGVGDWVKQDKPKGKFRPEIVDAALEALQRQNIASFDAVCAVPSHRTKNLVPDLAKALAKKLNVPYLDCIIKVRETEPQKLQQNSMYQTKNLDGAFEVNEPVKGNILLIDDMVDSGWTFTIVGALLRGKGAETVTPLALASTSHLSDND